jgi:type I restriction enzyme S subunit
MKWPIVPVGEIAQQVRGVSYDKSQVSNSAAPGLRPVLRAGNIQEGSLLLDKDLVYVPDSCIAHQQLLRHGDIVIAASSGSIDVVGKAAQLSEPWEGSFGAFCKVVRPSSDRVNPRYLHHFFQSTGYRRKVSSLAAGANINNLKNEHIDDLLLPLPPLEEQRRIAAILDKASSIGASQQRRTALLWQLEASLFSQMATENVSELNNCMLKELTAAGDKINYGVVQPGNQFDGGVPLIRVGDLVSGGVDRSSIKCIAPAIEAAYTRSRIVGNEILLSCVGSIGVVAMVQPWDIGSNIARAVARVPVSQTVNRKWLAACLRSTPVQRYFVNELRTVSQPTLNIKQIEETIIHLPPIELQNAFAIKLDAIERLCKRSSFSEEKSCNMISAFQSRVFQVVLDPQ